MDLKKITIPGYQFTNWSRTFTCTPEAYFVPETIEEIREIIYLAKSESKRIRVVGCGASPSDICLSEDYMIDLARFNHVLHLDREEAQVTVQGGIRLTELNRFLEANGLAMPVLGSISESTIAGVISVGTHGTGFQTGIIADYVLELRLVVPSGDIVLCSRDAHSELFLSALCGLGALGIIVQVTLQVVPKFYLHQLTYPSSLDHVLDNLDELVESSDHFRFLWFPHTDYVSVSVTNRINGAFLRLSDIDYHSRRRLSGSGVVLNGTDDDVDSDNHFLPIKLSSEKTWYQRTLDWLLAYGLGYHVLQFAYWTSTYLPALVPYINRVAFWALYSTPAVQLDVSHRIFNFECLFDQYVDEWAIPRSQTADVLRSLRTSIEAAANSEKPLYVHFPVEVRFARPSDIYLSPSFGRDSTYINIICYRPYRKYVDHTHWWDVYEAAVKRAGGRPHWAKQHRETATDLTRMYPYFRSWTALRRRLDPPGIFGNAYLDRIFGEGSMNTSRASAAVGLFARKNFEGTISSSPAQQFQSQQIPSQQHPPSNVSAASSSNDQDLQLSTSWSSIASTETTDLLKIEDDECDSIATLLSAGVDESKVEKVEKVEAKAEDKAEDDHQQKNGDGEDKEEMKKDGDQQKLEGSPSSTSISSTTSS